MNLTQQATITKTYGTRRDRQRVAVEALAIEPPEWVVDAVCASVDPEIFYPEKGGTTHHAKRVCRDCPVKVECLEYALAQEERFGVWGGLSEQERSRLAPRNYSCDACPLAFRTLHGLRRHSTLTHGVAA